MNELHEYLLNKANNEDNANYELDKLFDDNIYYKPIQTKRAFYENYTLYESNGDNISSLYEYFAKIKPYLSTLIDFYKEQGEYKAQPSMQIKFISFVDNTESQIMHSKSDNVEIMSGYDTDNVINMLTDTFTKRYQQGLETKMKGSSYFFDRIELLEYHFHKMTLNRGSSYMPTLSWIANKKCTINPQNDKDNRCYLYAIVLALNYHKISNHPERISNFIPFTPNYNWDEINFPAGSKEYNAFEKYNDTIALNVFYAPHNENKIRPVYISKFNKTREHHANLLMITEGKDKWHYITIKSIPALLRGVTSAHNGDFYCLNCFHSSRTAKKFNEHEELCVKNNFCLIKMPTDDKKYITSTPGKNTLKNLFIIYADFECLLYPISTCDNTSNNSFTIKKNIHKPCGYSLLTSYPYDKSLNEHVFYRGKDCLQKFSETLKCQVNKIINIKQKPMDLLTEQEKVLHNNAKIWFICEKSFCNNKNNIKVKDHCHYTGKYREAAHSPCNLRYKIPKSIPVVFHNGSSYDFHVIINQLAKDFDGTFSCLGKNTEKYITFSISIFKKACSDKKPIAYQIKFIDSYRHMSQSLSNLVDNLAELNKNLPANVLIKRYHNTYQLCDNNIEKFKILLRKGIYPYEHMSSWKKFNEPVPLMKKYYYSELNDENISDADLAHVKNICDTFNIANLGDYHDLYVSLDVALLADVFENFRDTSINIDKLDHAYCLSATGLSWQSCLKKTGVKLELLTDENMLLLFEKGIRGGMCNVIHKLLRLITNI